MPTIDVAIREAIREAVASVERQVLERAYPASNALRNAALMVLGGQRHGRRYRVPYTRRYYTASAPGEPPAVRTGALRLSWLPRPRREGQTTYLGIYSGIPYAQYLDPELTGLAPGTRVAPRPYVVPIKQRAWPEIRRIYQRPYL